MELSPEQERRLAQLASSRGGDVPSALDELLDAAEEAKQEWVTRARVKWREGVAASERGEAAEMNPVEFSAFLDQCLADAARQH
jgi:hypothetical protein